MATKNLKSCVEILGRYTRSVDIKRDCGDVSALRGYVITPQGASVLSTLLEGLSENSYQRAWILSGHYGVGKSALSLLLVSILSRLGGNVSKKIQDICSNYPELKTMARRNFSYDVIIVSGNKNRFSTQLISAVKSKIGEMTVGAGRPPAVLKQATAFLEKIEHDNYDDFAAIEIFDQFLEYWKKHAPAGKRLLLVVDEMGAIIEHMSSYQDKNAPAIFQYLAEKSAGRGPMSVLGIMHRSIHEYGAEWDKDALKEWSRIADRFEHIALQGSVEHVVYLLEKSIQLNASEAFMKGVKTSARKMRQGHPFGKTTEGVSGFEKIFPVHPATSVLLKTVAQRFQQSDRSFFSFLMSAEVGGLQEFITQAKAEPASWYRVEHLSEFLLNGGLRISDMDRRRRLVTLEDIVNNPLPDALQNRILKTVAVMDVLQPVVEVPMTSEAVAWAVGDDDKCPQILAAIEHLIKSGYLHRRHHDGRISVWARGGVNLALEFEGISVQQGDFDVDAVLPILQDWQHLQAHKHYLETGHMRRMPVELVQYGDNIKLPDMSQGPVVQLILINSQRHRQTVIKNLRKHTAKAGRNLLVHACFLGSGEWVLLKNWSVWKWMLECSEQVRADEIAYVEVLAQAKEHENKIKKLLGLDSAFRRDALFKKTWFRGGKLEKIENMRQFQCLLSDMMKEVYHSAPIIKNELINRPKLSAPVSSARNRLIEGILESPEEKELGIRDGLPPEKLIYYSLLAKSGIHRKSRLTGKMGIFPPVEGDEDCFATLWQALDAYLHDEDNAPMSAKSLSVLLTQPPYGLNEPLAVLLVALYIITAWNKVSVMEKGTLQLMPGKEMFMRFFKNPANFSVKSYTQTDESENILKSYASVDVLDNIKIGSSPVVAVAREIYCWYNGLSEYAKRTPFVSEKTKHFRATLERAREPFGLVMQDIPQTVGGSNMGRGNSFSSALNVVINELDGVYARLIDNIARLCPLSFGKKLLSPLEFQDYLMREYQDIVPIISGREKVFFERCSRPIKDDKEWFSSLASAVTGVHPEKWQEQHEVGFQLEMRSLASTLQRKKALASAADGGRPNALQVYFLNPDGSEAAVILDAPPDIAADGVLTAELLATAKNRGISNFDHALVQLLRERERGGVIFSE